jgi:hypothetical protein
MGYQDWVNVGMALYHHGDGDELGLEIWHEWSGESTITTRQNQTTRSTFSISA